MVHCAKGKAYFLWTIMHGMYTYEATLVGPQALWLAYFSGVLAQASLAPPEKACYSIEKKEEEDTSLWKLQENIMILKKYNDENLI